MTSLTSGMSSPSSAIEVATNTFISPALNFCIISFCSFCLSPVVFPLACSFIAWPTKFSALMFSIVFRISDIFLTVSRNWAKMIILESGFVRNCLATSFFRSSSFGCSLFVDVARENAFENLGSATSFWTPLDFFSEACL